MITCFTRKRYQCRLPFWSKAVFFDWNGTLSNDFFWNNIINNPKHPLYKKLNKKTMILFKEHKELVREWMRGDLDSSYIVDWLNIPLDKRFKPDFLLRNLIRSCEKMKCNEQMKDLALLAKKYALVVIATDNMDCFSKGALKNNELNKIADDILCSSDLGLLKTQNITDFFGDWLSANSIQIENSLLIDDCETTCLAFKDAGGYAIHYNNYNSVMNSMLRWLNDTK